MRNEIYHETHHNSHDIAHKCRKEKYDSKQYFEFKKGKQ